MTSHWVPGQAQRFALNQVLKEPSDSHQQAPERRQIRFPQPESIAVPLEAEGHLLQGPVRPGAAERLVPRPEGLEVAAGLSTVSLQGGEEQEAGHLAGNGDFQVMEVSFWHCLSRGQHLGP